jgi:ATP-dependent RNA helicase DeaD
MKTFQELALSESLQKALMAMNFTTPTPIQAQAIPVVMTGRDLIGCAQTGTGKTGAFSIPIISTLLQNKDQTALILAPTRELAIQITEVIENLTAFCKHIRVINLIGGMSMQHQVRNVQKGYRIIVATPGRLLDHAERNKKLLANVSMFVLDEADRMLDMGFAPQLRRIFPLLPVNRQTMLFSATLPTEIQEIANRILRKPQKVQVGEVSVPAEKINQQAKQTNGEQKNDLLLDELNNRHGSVLVFVRTQRRADRVCGTLEEYGVKVTRIHGGRSQGQRNRALSDFRDGVVRVLVATDIAARGIDISHVAHVINYDLPQVPEDYVHRIGRTARAGRAGEAMSFISSDDVEMWRNIEKLLAQKGIRSPLSLAKNVKHTPRPQQPSRKPQVLAQQQKPQQQKQGRPQGQKQAQQQGQKQAQPQSQRQGQNPSAQSDQRQQGGFRKDSAGGKNRPRWQRFGSGGGKPNKQSSAPKSN